MNSKTFIFKLKTNPIFRLIIYILLEISIFILTTMKMDYSTGYVAPLSNCLCFLFIAFEIAFFHYQLILLIILVLKVVVLLVCNYFVGSLNYIIVFSVCFFILKISDLIIYKKHNLNEFTFPLARRELIFRSFSKYNCSFVISQLVILSVCFFIHKTIYELIIPIVFILIAINKDRTERKWGKIPFLSYYKTTFIELVFLSITVFSVSNIGIVGNLSTETIISVLVPVFVFNITTLFLLIQFNYNKFGSTYLLKTIITIPILFFTIIIPVCIILFLGFFAETMISDTAVLAIVKFGCLSAVFVSSLLYLLFFTQSLESWKLLNSILTTVNEDDIANNRNYIISYDETKFDAVTRIIKTDISKNDLIALRSDLYGIVYWSRENISSCPAQSELGLF